MSYFPMVSGASTNLDENKRISDAELTIIFRKAQQATQVPNLTNLQPVIIIFIGKKLVRLVIIVS